MRGDVQLSQHGVHHSHATGDTHQKDGKFIDQNRVIIMKKGVKYNVAGQRVKK
jgi:hypothetical protein